MGRFDSWAIVGLTVLGMGAKALACPATMVILVQPSSQVVKVGQTVVFTAVCDSVIQAYEWIFPSTAYGIQGQGTAEASCKFSPVGQHSVRLRYKFNGVWYGMTIPQSVVITVQPAGNRWYVRTDGSDHNDGQSWQTAFQTIQTAVNSADNGHEIIAAEGIYREHISLKGKNLIVRSRAPNDWTVVNHTILQGYGRGAVVFLEGTETADCLLQGITVTGGGFAEENPLNHSPQAYWKLDEGAGESLSDYSGNEHTGTKMGAGWIEGKLKNALVFDGDDHIVVSGYSGIPGGWSRTICAWIRTEQPGMIFTYGNPGTGTRWLFFVNNNKQLQLGIGGANTYSLADVADGQWHHVAAVLQSPVSSPAKAEHLRLYIDGCPAEAAFYNPSQVILTDISSTWPVRLGACQTSAGGDLTGYFQGSIDDVRFYDQALTEEEIRALCSQGGGIRGNGTLASISNCVIRDNQAGFDGGGISNVDGPITNCFILKNQSQADGGGLAGCDGLVADCIIEENEAANGAGIYNDQNNPKVQSCTIKKNIARQSGGAVFNVDCNDLVFLNCKFLGNIDQGLSIFPLPPVVLSQIKPSWYWDSTYGRGNDVIVRREGQEYQILWGEPANNECSFQSGLGFTNAPLPMSFDIDHPFRIGQLRHFNYIQKIGTAAEKVKLTIELEVENPPAREISYSFFLTIDETKNSQESTCVPSCCADTIIFPSFYPSETVSLGGRRYTLQILGFGEDPNHLDLQFSSPEGQTNSISLWAMLIPPPLESSMKNIQSRVLLSGCLFSGNVSPSYGGALSNWACPNIVLKNCTLSGNHARFCGGIYSFQTNLEMVNSILWANTDEQNLEGPYYSSLDQQIYNFATGEEGSQNSVDYSCIQNDGLILTPRLFHDNINRQVLIGFVLQHDQNSSVPGVKLLGSWEEGLAHIPPEGINRALLFFVHAKQENIEPNVVQVTYGGRILDSIIKKTEKGTSNWPIFVGAYILGEEGIRAAESDTFTVTWAQNPNYCCYSSVFLSNVNQVDKIGDIADGSIAFPVKTSGSTETAPVHAERGDRIFVASSVGAVGTYTLESGFVQTFRSSSANQLDAIVVSKSIEGLGGIGNIYENPAFIREPNDGGDGWGVGIDDFGDLQLKPGSPCIDAGNNLAVLEGIFLDLAGNPRFVEDPNSPQMGCGLPPFVDIGAYEYQVYDNPQGNLPPQVDAGAAKIVRLGNWIEMSDAAASDEESLDYLWTRKNGPGLVRFEPGGPQSDTSTVLHPRVWFSEPGIYTLQLLADDGDLSSSDTVFVTAVRVTAGLNQTIYLPQEARLDASIEGAPLVSVQWSVLPQVSQSVNVSFNPYTIQNYDTAAFFSEPGFYVLQIKAVFEGFDEEFIDEVSVNVLANPDAPGTNAQPVVRAWAQPDTIIWPANTTSLFGQAADDGLPARRLDVQWKLGYSSTFGNVTFGAYSVTNPAATATFSQPGVYELILAADDGALQSSRSVLVQVLPPEHFEANGQPTVYAGGNRTIQRSPFTPLTILLAEASAHDPTPTGYWTAKWTWIDGPAGGLALEGAQTIHPTLTFFEPGQYTLLLTVSDGQFTVSDQAVFTITTEPITSAFKITAGSDQMITLPAAAYLDDAAVIFADSNQPYPLDSVSIQWSKIAGPGDVEFFIPDTPDHPAPSTVLNPSVRFSKAGIYKLQLFTSDLHSALLDEVQIQVDTGRRIATHVFGSYVVDDDDTVWSAGSNHYGQLGNGWSEPVYQFYLDRVISGDQGEHPYLNSIESIAAGWIHCLALDKNRNLWAFGAGNSGALGQGDTENYYAPVRVLAGEQPSQTGYLEKIVSIGAGCAHSLAVDEEGYVWAWGWNGAGQLGNGQSKWNMSKPAWGISRESGDLLEESPSRVGSSNIELDIYYRFDKIIEDLPTGFPNILFDSSGNRHTGYFIPMAGRKLVDGIVNSAGQFKKDDFITLGSPDDTDPNYYGVCGSRPRTLSVWVRRISPWKYPIGTVVSWGSPFSAGSSWEVKCIDGIVGIYVSADNFHHKIQTVASLPADDDWYHIIVLLPEGKKRLEDIQIWGGKEGQPILQQQTLCPSPDPVLIHTEQYFYAVIGNTCFDPNTFSEPNGLEYYGLMDELQIYNRALSEKEICYLHSNPARTSFLRNIASVDGGRNHSVALEKFQDDNVDRKGRVYTFGENTDHVLGIGECDKEDSIRSLPVCVKGGEQGTDYLQNIVQISSGWYPSTV